MDAYAEQAENDVYVNDDEPITQEEIDEAKVTIAKLHPMINIPFDKVFPTIGCFFKCCLCCGGRQDRIDEYKRLLKKEREEHDVKIADLFKEFDVNWTGRGPDAHTGERSSQQTAVIEETDPKYDPYSALGFGWQCYFNTLSSFTILFVVLTIVMLPCFYYNSQIGGLKDVSRGYYNSVYMLGNLGFNKAVCASKYIGFTESQPAYLKCEIGIMSDIEYSGMLASELDYTWENIAYGYCGSYDSTDIGTSESSQVPPNTQTCTDTFLDQTSLYNDFSTNCTGYNNCTFQIHQYVNYDVGTAEEQSLCLQNPGKIYIQYKCTQDNDSINDKRQMGLAMASCCALSGLIFLLLIFYQKKMSTQDFQMWDLETLTASDFTIEITITESMWNSFNTQLGMHSSQLPRGKAAPNHLGVKLPVATFEAFLEIKLCEKLNQCPKVNVDCHIKIANITFGFDNAEMLTLLSERGSLITSGKLEKVPPINDKIEALSKEKKTEWIRPVAAFITFDRQEGKDRALKYFPNPKSKVEYEDANTGDGVNVQLMENQRQLERVGKTLLEEPLICNQAPEPSEILWHNRHVTYKQQNWHKAVVFIVSAILLFLMFILFSFMKAISIKNMWRYPATTNCDSVESLFYTEGVTDLNAYESYAEIDQPLTAQRQGTGIYQCYCATYKTDQAYTDSNNLCNTYVHDQIGGYAISETITVVITIVNTVIRTLCVMMIKKVGYHTQTGEITAITVSIFIATFFNTAILLLLADADLSQVPFISWIPLRGPFPDLTEQWYIIIAPSLIMTMVINAFYAYIDLGIAFATQALFRGLDQGFKTYLCCVKEKTTKCKTIQSYVNLYAGPQHSMSYRYSAILVTSYICLMYSIAIPEMLPIGALTYFNYYIVDRFLVAYYYQKPPVYDDKLNRTTLNTLKYSPLLMYCFGYWCLGNMQLFSNVVPALINSGKPLTTDHDAAPGGNQALPLFIFGMIAAIMFVATDCCTERLKKLNLIEDDEIKLIDEDVGSYFQCVSVPERKRWYAQELHSQKNLGIESIGEDTMEAMRTTNGNVRVIKNAPNYEVLGNIDYCQAFQFTPIDMCDTQEEQQISDMISKVMYMGYLREGKQDFSFSRILNKRGHKRAQFLKKKEDTETFNIEK